MSVENKITGFCFIEYGIGRSRRHTPQTPEGSYRPPDWLTQSSQEPRCPSHFRSGYKEKQHLVVVDSTYQSSNRDEKKEHPHRNDSSDDMDAGHQTQALSPRSHSNEQQAYQLRETAGCMSKECQCASPPKAEVRAVLDNDGELSFARGGTARARAIPDTSHQRPERLGQA